MKKITIIAVAALLMLTGGAAQAKKKATTGAATTSAQVIYTGEIAKKVVGYNGTTPLNITIRNGKIQKIEALENQETPAYFDRAFTKIAAQYEGKTVNEALNMDVDAVTGATYSSEAIIKNIKMGLQQAKPATKKTGKKATKGATATKRKR